MKGKYKERTYSSMKKEEKKMKKANKFLNLSCLINNKNINNYKKIDSDNNSNQYKTSSVRMNNKNRKN